MINKKNIHKRMLKAFKEIEKYSQFKIDVVKDYVKKEQEVFNSAFDELVNEIDSDKEWTIWFNKLHRTLLENYKTVLGTFTTLKTDLNNMANSIDAYMIGRYELTLAYFYFEYVYDSGYDIFMLYLD